MSSVHRQIALSTHGQRIWTGPGDCADHVCRIVGIIIILTVQTTPNTNGQRRWLYITFGILSWAPPPPVDQHSTPTSIICVCWFWHQIAQSHTHIQTHHLNSDNLYVCQCELKVHGKMSIVPIVGQWDSQFVWEALNKHMKLIKTVQL